MRGGLEKQKEADHNVPSIPLLMGNWSNGSTLQTEEIKYSLTWQQKGGHIITRAVNGEARSLER